MQTLEEIKTSLESQIESGNLNINVETLAYNGLNTILAIVNQKSVSFEGINISIEGDRLIISGSSELLGEGKSELSFVLFENGEEIELYANIGLWQVPQIPSISLSETFLFFKAGTIATSPSGSLSTFLNLSSLTIPLSMELPGEQAGMTLKINGNGIPLTDLNVLAELVGVENLDIELPEQLSAITSLQLLNLELGIENNSITYISLGVELANNWIIIEDKLSINNITFNLSLYYPFTTKPEKRTEFSLSADLMAGKTEIPVLLSKGESDVWQLLIAEGDGIELPSLDDIISFAGGNDAKNELPEELRNLPSISVANLDLMFNPKAKSIDSFGFEIKTSKSWTPSTSSQFTLEALYYLMKVESPFVSASRKISGKIGARTSFGNNLIIVGGAFQKEGASFMASYAGNISIADVGKVLGFSDIPNELSNFIFTGFDISFSSITENKSLSGSGKYVVEDKEVDLFLKIEQTGKAANKVTEFSGTFQYKQDINDPSKDLACDVRFVKEASKFNAKFFLKFPVSTATLYLEGGFSKDSETNKNAVNFSGGSPDLSLNLTQMLADLMEGLEFQMPEGLVPEISIEQVFVSFAKIDQEKDILLYAVATINNKEIKFFFQNKNNPLTAIKDYSFGLATDVADLGNMPLVGDQLKEVKLNNVGFVYASKAGDIFIPSGIEETTEDGIKVLRIIKSDAAKTTLKGLNMSGELYYSAKKPPFQLGLPVPQDPAPTTTPTAGGNFNTDNTPAPTGTSGDMPSLQGKQPDPSEKWVKFGKKIGPVNIAGLGFSYKDKMLTLLFRGDIDLAGLTVSLEGLGMGFNPSDVLKGDIKVPEFSLNGLGLSYKKPPVEISGAFLRTSKPGENLAFAGAAVLKAASFTITGMGAYTKLPTGEASLFIYALFDKPLGGPAFFFVTGIAAGFGYNRRVRIPDIAEVNEFPLVSIALSSKKKELAEILADLTSEPPWIPPSKGDYWLAIGIKFTSFKLIESFLLLIVEMGNRLVFNILGLALLRWPDKSLMETPIVNIELALKITFGPDSDVIAVQAIITPNSYVLDKSVKLGGGFAFFTWISGEHEGDFVITLGGYHPKFKKPAHYPNVDRLSLNWKLDKFPLTVRGELYFALTPKAVMAGGRWEVAYDIGFLKAYLIIWADMLIQWAPFQYFIDVGVRIGIQANIKIWFVVIRFKLEIGAELHIWGPPFAGEVKVDWSIFSFTIPFGDRSKKEPAPLPWADFHDSFIPQVDDVAHPLDTRIQDGIIKTITDENDNLIATIVNPYSLVLAADSFFPLGQIFNDASESNPLDDDTLMNLSDSDFPGFYASYKQKAYGIKPMKVTQLNTNLHTWLMKKGEAGGPDLPVTEDIAYSTNAKGMPSALWANNSSDGIPDVIPSAVAGIEIHTTEEVDKTIVNIILGKYDLREKSKGAIFYANADALGQLDKEIINTRISNNINKPAQKSIEDDLLNLGFELSPSDSLVFDEIGIDTPIYLASIGQKIPKIIVN